MFRCLGDNRPLPSLVQDLSAQVLVDNDDENFVEKYDNDDKQ